MTRKEFAPVFQRLARQLRAPEFDLATIADYFDVLGDLPLAAVTAGAATLAKTAAWFPKTSEWREAAAAAQTVALRAAVYEPRGEPWHHECPDCADTGWVQGLTCPGDPTCGRPKPHAPHPYVVACRCRPTNRTYLRHHHVGAGA